MFKINPWFPVGQIFRAGGLLCNTWVLRRDSHEKFKDSIHCTFSIISSNITLSHSIFLGLTANDKKSIYYFTSLNQCLPGDWIASFANPEFDDWKAQTEEEEQTSFKMIGRVKNKDGDTVEYHQCNRSGVYKPRIKGKDRKRHMKTSGQFSVLLGSFRFL